MKAEIILAIVWTSLCTCERQQRSTVLTDEYKRVLEHFDFSNFDKQEALNYIDRQRYENQIRGKRSHSKFKRNHGKSGKFSDMIVKEKGISHSIKFIGAVYPTSQFQICQRLNEPKKIEANEWYPEMDTRQDKSMASVPRFKRAHHGKRYRAKCTQNELEEEEEEEEEEEGEDDDNEIKIRRRRKKKKRRRRKKKRKKKRKPRYWNNWSEWSSCSVTCGRGRKIRWRKCIVKKCATGDLEMGEKTCQLPACNLLTKLLGL